MKFVDIIKKLERHYDVKINNKNKSLEEELITATFDIETIEQVFEVIKELHPMEYKIQDKINNLEVTIHVEPITIENE